MPTDSLRAFSKPSGTGAFASLPDTGNCGSLEAAR